MTLADELRQLADALEQAPSATTAQMAASVLRGLAERLDVDEQRLWETLR